MTPWCCAPWADAVDLAARPIRSIVRHPLVHGEARQRGAAWGYRSAVRTSRSMAAPCARASAPARAECRRRAALAPSASDALHLPERLRRDGRTAVDDDGRRARLQSRHEHNGSPGGNCRVWEQACYSGPSFACLAPGACCFEALQLLVVLASAAGAAPPLVFALGVHERHSMRSRSCSVDADLLLQLLRSSSSLRRSPPRTSAGARRPRRARARPLLILLPLQPQHRPWPAPGW